jgi:hypothetical protein
MDFKNLLQDTDCDCLENAVQDNRHFYARKINKPAPLDRDFKSHWERGKQSVDNCEKICGLKGISMNLWNQTTEKAIIKKFLTTFSITPKHKDSIFVFKCLPESGLTKYTPNEEDDSHYDFYKSDEFSLDKLENYKIILLKDCISNE